MSFNSAMLQDLWTYHSQPIGDLQAEFAVVLPKNYQPTKKYPLLLALPPGGQNKYMVDLSLQDYWALQAYNRGWIVISPVRPGRSFASNDYIIDLLDLVRDKYPIDENELHIAGNSNGGQSAFRVIEKYPRLFRSVTVLAGYSLDFKSLDKASHMKFNLFVGERDYGWKVPMIKMKDHLLEIGAQVDWQVIKKEGHEIHALKNHDILFDVMQIK